MLELYHMAEMLCKYNITMVSTNKILSRKQYFISSLILLHSLPSSVVVKYDKGTCDQP